MHKTLLLSAFCLGAWFALPAQFSLNVHGGANLSRLSFSREGRDFFSPPDLRAGFQVGIAPAIKGEANRFEFAVPLQYAVRTYNISENPLPGFNVIENNRLHYAEMNPRLGYYITPALVFSVGGYLGCLLAAQNDFENKWRAYSNPVKNGIFEAIDFGFGSGARVHIDRFFLYGGAQVGLSTISSMRFTDVNGEPIFTIRRRNLNFQLGAGYTLLETKK